MHRVRKAMTRGIKRIRSEGKLEPEDALIVAGFVEDVPKKRETKLWPSPSKPPITPVRASRQTNSSRTAPLRLAGTRTVFPLYAQPLQV